MDSRSENWLDYFPDFFLRFVSIGATIRTRPEIQCLPYAEFFWQQTVHTCAATKLDRKTNLLSITMFPILLFTNQMRCDVNFKLC